MLLINHSVDTFSLWAENIDLQPYNACPKNPLNHLFILYIDILD